VTYLLTQAAKFVALFLMIVYMINAFLMLRREQEEERVGAYRFGNFLVFGIHLSCFAAILLHQPHKAYLLFYAEQVVFFAAFLLLYRLLYKKCNLLIQNNVFLLLAVGLSILTRLNFDKAQKQFLICIAASVVAMVIPVLLDKMRVTKALAGVLGVVGVLLLGAVLLLSRTTYGANLSLSIHGITVQPSEFVKVSYVLLIAMLFRNRKDVGRIFLVTCIAMLHTGILVLSKDLGGALIYYMTFLAMLYVASQKKRYPLLCGMLLCVGAVGAYMLFSHVRVRVTAWLDPWSVIEKEGYQITQSLFSVANGSWFGLGIFEGQPQYIPVVEKDFVFSAISEELGAIFAMGLILVCLCLLLAMIKVAARCSVVFYKLIGIGMAALYGFQVFLTVGGAMKLIPSTGVTLPLVSYGGSSLLSTMIIIGIIQGLYLKTQKVEQAEALEEQLRAGTTETRTVNQEGKVIIRRRVKRPNRQQKKILQANDTKDVVSSKRNKEAYGIGYIYMAIFAVLVGYLGYFLISAPSDARITENFYNLARVNAKSDTVIRGDILSSDGVVLATTVQDDDGNDVRYYPYDNLFAHVVGYAGKSSSGIENLANTYLLTSTMTLSEQISADLHQTKTVGDTVVTTIQSNLQYEAYQVMGDNQGAVVVMEADTGRILAMVSKPDYNPNDMENIWNSLSYLDSSESFLVNRATQGQYPPGSTFKLLTALAYMREHPDDFEDFTYDCTGAITYENTTINCSENHVHGLMNIRTGLQQSCNGTFALMGTMLQNQTLMDLCDSLLFNSELPIDIRYKKSSFAINESSTAQERMQAAIGQGQTLISPLHSAMITASIANGGTMMKPYFVDEVDAGNGSVVESFQPEEIAEVMTEDEAAWLEDAMLSVVSEGTAYLAASDAYYSAGKTGSAQFSSSLEKLHAWYTGYAWQDGGHKIVVSVILEGAGSGGLNAAPVAKAVFDAYFGIEE
jgi:peptidoglycan glycosyltransferase